MPGGTLRLPAADVRTTEPRRSRRGRWRAVVLGAVQLAIVAHATHYLLAGRTLSPVEPSESMYTLELGQLNAGFVFFALALLATLVFGRFVCGWGCHLVALQDLCAWLMKRAGVRPRPFRSRLLALAPWALALYMFAWPTVARVAFGRGGPFPGFSNHFVTSSFWATFPGPVFAVLTLATCGFAAVYVLGAKGFCTYGCPYGALFGAADRLAPGRIVASDACAQCGHCTAACTSNVRVHEDVKLYRAIVDPNCMKCTDCVSVCPTGALSFGWTRPPLLRRADRSGTRAARFDLTWPEELLVAAVAFVATLAFRGLYDGPPLLMAIALGGLVAFGTLLLVRLARRADVRLQNLRLRQDGRLRASGFAAAAIVPLALLFTAHSAFVQWERAAGQRALERTAASRGAALDGSATRQSFPRAHFDALEAAERHFTRAARWGLRPTVEVENGLAWCRLLRGDRRGAEAALRAALAVAPAEPALRRNLLDFLLAEGALRAETGELEAAARAYAEVAAAEPENAVARFDLGGVLRRLGRTDAAIEQLAAARRLAPNDADAAIELGLAYMAAGRRTEALESLRRAIALAPDSPESKEHLPGLIAALERGR